MKLYCEEHGAGAPTIVLLHGMGANGAVWEGVLGPLRERYPGRIIVPDLRGHGRSDHGDHYGMGQHAADVAELIAADERVVVVGHSMGGGIGLALASGWFGVRVTGVVAFSTVTAFSAAELDKLAALARKEVRWFDDRAEAAARFLMVSGLDGLVPPGAAVVDAGIAETDGRYRLRADPRTGLVAGDNFGRLLTAARCPVTLACGGEDRMVGLERVRAFDPDAVELAGLGHNPHVEDPGAIVGLLEATGYAA